MKINQKGAGSIGISTMVIPVEVRCSVEELLSYFPIQPVVDDSPIDSTKYFAFVANSVIGKEKAILKPYKFRLDQLKFNPPGQDSKGLFSQARIAIGSTGISDPADAEAESYLEFSIADIWFFLNQGAGLGYFCVPFHWNASDPEVLLRGLAASSFFRFTENGKNSLFSVGGTSFAEMSVLAMLKGFFPGLLAGIPNGKAAGSPIQIIGKKPILLHVLHWNAGGGIQQRHRQAYQILRVAKRQNLDDQRPLDQSNTDFISSILLDNAIGIYLMNEGALVLDSNEDVRALWKKYFPTFLLAVNQRQLLIHLVAQIMAADIKVPILSKEDLEGVRENEHLLLMRQAKTTMEHLHTHIIQLQLKQIFYSVAHTDELNIFLHKLQERFRISHLLQDIKESVGELHQILEAISAHDHWLREKKRELAINLVGLLIGALGVISTIEDILDNNSASMLHHNISYGVVAAITLGLGAYFVRKGSVS